MVCWKKKENKHGLMALVGETAKMAKKMMVLDKTEAALEKELERERTHIPSTKVGKFRKKGEHLLHSKQVLLTVVILNVIDCLLVLGELMLDIQYVTGLLTKEYKRQDAFIATMKGLYPARLDYIVYDDIITLEYELKIASITWDNHGGSHDQSHGQSQDGGMSNITLTTITTPMTPHSTGLVRKRRASGSSPAHGNTTHPGHDHAHSIEEDIAHGLHKASITILGILMIETMMKIFCIGRELLDHKLECFDGFIVCVSFIVDLVFLKGLQQFTVQEFVLILAFMVPWRVIRVVNSLVVAIMDHEHFRLKLLYKQKKKTANELKEAQSEITGSHACIKSLEKLCSDAGVSDDLVKAKLSLFRKLKGKSNPMAALSNFAIGGNAMKMPFPNGNTNHITDIVVTVESDKNGNPTEKEVHAINHFTTDKKENTNDLRPRSKSAGEEGQSPTGSLEHGSVNLLAERSVSFIATISNDGSIHKTHTIEKQTDEVHTEDRSTSRGNGENQEPDTPPTEASTAEQNQKASVIQSAKIFVC